MNKFKFFQYFFLPNGAHFNTSLHLQTVQQRIGKPVHK